MASVFGHGLVAYTITRVVKKKEIRLLLLLAIVSSIVPDADVIAFKLGIAYEHPLGHRGVSHSIVYAVLWAMLLTYWFGRASKRTYFTVLFLSTISHGIFDAMTNGGKGVGFFIPFDNSRHFFSWRPIRVSPLGVKDFFSDYGMQVILSELRYIALPCGIILFVVWMNNRINAIPRN